MARNKSKYNLSLHKYILIWFLWLAVSFTLIPWVNNPPAGDTGDAGQIPGSRRSPGGGKRQLTPVFLPGKGPGQRSLAGYSTWGHKY